MKRNVGTTDRLLRAGAGAAMIGCSIVAPFPLLARLLTFGLMGAVLLMSSVAGRCLGYALLGRSTCPVNRTAGGA
jgi:hypothetical protein